MRAMRTLQVAVKRGHEKLMKHDREYFKKIDVDKLNIESCNLCILGQLGGFCAVGFKIFETGGLSDIAWKYGFEGKEQGFGLSRDKFAEEKILSDIWKRRIKKLQASS